MAHIHTGCPPYPHAPSLCSPLPEHEDPAVLEGDLRAMLSESDSGHAWAGEAADLARKVLALLDAECYSEGTDPCVCEHGYNRHTGAGACSVTLCGCLRYIPKEGE